MEYISTRNNKKTFEFKDVFIKGLADDGVYSYLNLFTKLISTILEGLSTMI